jgi:hypothetical protein
MYDYEYGDTPPEKKSLSKRMNERISDKLKQVESKEYRRKKRKLDEIKRMEEE